MSNLHYINPHTSNGHGNHHECDHTCDHDNNLHNVIQSNSQIVTWSNQHVNQKIFNMLIERSGDADIVKSSRHAAAVVYRGQVLSTGVNQRKTHPIMAKLQKNPERVFLHAEVDAIIRTINLHGVDILQDCAIYVLRTTKSGKVAGSQPCQGCQQFIDSVGIQHVYWSK